MQRTSLLEESDGSFLLRVMTNFRPFFSNACKEKMKAKYVMLDFHQILHYVYLTVTVGFAAAIAG